MEKDTVAYRASMLPLVKNYDGTIGFGMPSFVKSLMKSAKLPGDILKTGVFKPQDVTEFALNFGILGAPVGAMTSPKGVLAMGASGYKVPKGKTWQKTVEDNAIKLERFLDFNNAEWGKQVAKTGTHYYNVLDPNDKVFTIRIGDHKPSDFNNYATYRIDPEAFAPEEIFNELINKFNYKPAPKIKKPPPKLLQELNDYGYDFMINKLESMKNYPGMFKDYYKMDYETAINKLKKAKNETNSNLNTFK